MLCLENQLKINLTVEVGLAANGIQKKNVHRKLAEKY